MTVHDHWCSHGQERWPCACDMSADHGAALCPARLQSVALVGTGDRA